MFVCIVYQQQKRVFGLAATDLLAGLLLENPAEFARFLESRNSSTTWSTGGKSPLVLLVDKELGESSGSSELAKGDTLLRGVGHHQKPLGTQLNDLNIVTVQRVESGGGERRPSVSVDDGLVL